MFNLETHLDPDPTTYPSTKPPLIVVGVVRARSSSKMVRY